MNLNMREFLVRNALTANEITVWNDPNEMTVATDLIEMTGRAVVVKEGLGHHLLAVLLREMDLEWTIVLMLWSDYVNLKLET